MKSTKASIALCVMIFLVVQGEAHMLKRAQKKFVAAVSDDPAIERLGSLQFSVTWSLEGDGDIVVRTPTGNNIHYLNRGPNQNTDYGQLEMDRTRSGPESIYWDASNAAPSGTYDICLRTGAFELSTSNPLTATATIFSPDDTIETVTKTFTEPYSSLTCDPSEPHYIGSFTYQPSEAPWPVYTPEPEPQPEPQPEPEQEQAPTIVLEQFGPVQVSVTWSREGDGDLIVKTPSGNMITYGNKGPSESTDFGRLEQDRRGFGPETVFWEDAAPAGTYQVCFRTAALGPTESNPVTVTATAFSPDGTRQITTKTFTQSSNYMQCSPSASNYVGSFVYHPSETPRPRPVYAVAPPPEEMITPEPEPIEPIIHHWEPVPPPMPDPIIIEEEPRDLTQLGPLQFSVTWSRPGDGDIIVQTPSGKVISYNNRGPTENTDYGQLEVDRTRLGPESIYWDGSHALPTGTYHICMRTNSFEPSPSNPVEATATIFSPDGNTETITHTFTESVSDLNCDPSLVHYIGSYTYQQE